MKYLSECERNEQEGRECVKLKGNSHSPRHERIKLAANVGLVIIGLVAWPVDSFAAGTLETPVAQLKAGTLPLLAALGLGIAVAVAAVIAFLNMTAKGKESNGIPGVNVQDDEIFLDSSIEDGSNNDWEDEPAMHNMGYEENPLSDYTIPITKLLTYPDHVESAAPGEPSLCGVEGEHSGSCYRILNRRLSFGRDPAQCAILFPYEAAQISRLHCTLSFVEEGRVFELEDHGSSNGTFLANGQRLEPGKRYELHAGQRFSLSGQDHWFEVRDDG